jgi:hypothetical protein
MKTSTPFELQMLIDKKNMELNDVRRIDGKDREGAHLRASAWRGYGQWSRQSRTRRYLLLMHGNPSRYLRHGVLRNVPILSDRGERAVKWPARVLGHTSGFVGFQCSLAFGQR